VDFPCPGDELVPAIRKIGKDLLVLDTTPNSTAHGERLERDKIDELVDTKNRHRHKTLLLCWVDSDVEWLLVEDEALVSGNAFPRKE
jgi:hypothetical protein